MSKPGKVNKETFGCGNVRPESEKEGKPMSKDIENIVRINTSQVAIEVLKNAFKETSSLKYYLPNEVSREKAVRYFPSTGKVVINMDHNLRGEV